MRSSLSKDDYNFIKTMLVSHAWYKRMMSDLEKRVNKLPYKFSDVDMFNTVICIIQQMDIDVLTLEYQREPDENFKSYWDKISERGHV